MAVQTDFIKSIPYFASMSSTELDYLKTFVFETTAERGDFIVLEGEPSGALYFVVSGVVKVLKTSADGKEQILQLVRPGESFNDVPVFDGGVNPASAQAMGPVVLYSIKDSDMSAILRSKPQVALNVIHILSQKMRLLLSLVEDLSFKHVVARLAKILLEHSGDKLTQQEMAAMAGTAREMIGRSLKELENENIVRLEHHRIVVSDKEALKQWAGVA